MDEIETWLRGKWGNLPPIYFVELVIQDFCENQEQIIIA